MGRARLLFILLSLALLLGASALGLAFHQWRAGKIAMLEPPPANSPANMPAETALAGTPAKPPVLLLFGDSRVAQWSPLPDRPYPIIAVGKPGWTAIRLEPLFMQALAEHRPAVVVIQAGVNDAVAASVAGKARRTQAQAATQAALGRMAAAGRAQGAHVILMEVPPAIRPSLVRRIVYGSRLDRYVADLNAALPALAEANGAEIFPTMARLSGPDGSMPGRFRRDSLHWTPEAYAALGALLPETLSFPETLSADTPSADTLAPGGAASPIEGQPAATPDTTPVAPAEDPA